MFAEILHIPPWQIGDLALDEVEQAIQHFDDIIKKAEAS